MSNENGTTKNSKKQQSPISDTTTDHTDERINAQHSTNAQMRTEEGTTVS